MANAPVVEKLYICKTICFLGTKSLIYFLKSFNGIALLLYQSVGGHPENNVTPN